MTAKKTLTLADLPPKSSAIVKALTMEGSMRRRLLDIGLVSGTKVICLGESPLGDPRAYLIRGAVIALRREDCKSILVTNKRKVKET